MKTKKLQYTKYILEIVALPLFLYLVFNFGLTGSENIIQTLPVPNILLEHVSGFSIFFGIFFLGLFTWIWHRPGFKRWIPCSHEENHEKTQYLQAIAITAFCLHFFPEAVIRNELFNSKNYLISLAAHIGFLAHFAIDIATGVMLSSYWTKTYQKILSFAIIVSVWLTAFFMKTNVFEFFPHHWEGIIMLFGAFLLAMFVHLPHKPSV